MENGVTNLRELVRKIQERKILLPDFQRGFVWKEEEKAIRLISSVLAKMPIGSILLLEAQADEYGCKMVGKRKRLDTSDLESQNVYMLLDGQQRITVLTNIFSSIIFADAQKSSELVNESALKKRFFIDLPSYKEILEGKPDMWGISKLCFPVNNPEEEYPKFLTNDIKECISVESFGFKEKEKPFHPKNEDNGKLEEFCTKTDKYRIPLFLLIETDEYNSDCETLLNNIFENIVNEIANRVLDNYEKIEDKTTYIQSILKPAYYKKIQDYEDRENVKDEIVKQGKVLWSGKFIAYLKACINKMNLHQIIVKQSERDRAIDIYENLNLGGVTLSTFELVLAKAAKSLDGDRKNLTDRIIEYIQKEKQYPDAVVPENLQYELQEFCKKNEYSASDRMKCYKSKNSELHKKYTDAFLNILCLYCNYPAYSSERVITVEYIKRTKILELKPEQINQNYEKVCKGLDRALFFLQVRCGLRTIDELQYNLVLVLLGYIFLEDKHFANKALHKKLEAWYWSGILSGYFDKDQNSRIIGEINQILSHMSRVNEKNGFEWIQTMADKIFDREDFSDQETVLMEKKNKIPKEVIKRTICQYYLAKTYYDLLNNSKSQEKEKINIFMDEVESLEYHHLIPLGDISNTVKSSRTDKTALLNSPINFIFITPDTNKQISAKSIESYLKECCETSVFKLGLVGIIVFEGQEKIIGEERARKYLNMRYTEVKNEIKGHVENLL